MTGGIEDWRPVAILALQAPPTRRLWVTFLSCPAVANSRVPAAALNASEGETAAGPPTGVQALHPPAAAVGGGVDADAPPWSRRNSAAVPRTAVVTQPSVTTATPRV